MNSWMRNKKWKSRALIMEQASRHIIFRMELFMILKRKNFYKESKMKPKMIERREKISIVTTVMRMMKSRCCLAEIA